MADFKNTNKIASSVRNKLNQIGNSSGKANQSKFLKMETLTDPKAQKEFFARRKYNNRLHTNREQEKENYSKLSEKSGLSAATLKEAAYGRSEEAFMNVASSNSLSNKEKNLILSGAIGKFKRDTSGRELPTHTFTQKWSTPVRATMCSPIEGRCYHKNVITRGGGQRLKERISNAERTNIDFSDIGTNNTYSDIIVKPITKQIEPLQVKPVSAINYLDFFNKQYGNSRT